MSWVEEIVAKLKEKGYWGDATDPCSGMPVKSRSGPTTFDDVSAHSTILRYAVNTVGGASGIPCKVVSLLYLFPLYSFLYLLPLSSFLYLLSSIFFPLSSVLYLLSSIF
jgi:hypothetical protein